MCVQHEETKHLQIILFTDLTDSTEVSKRLGHLAVVNVQECIVHPVFRKRNSIAAFTLCDLILMVREHKVFATGMDVDLLSKIFLGHNGALNMPARSSVAPWRGPVWLSFFLRFPEHEIQRIFLLILTGYLQGTES